MSGRDVHRGLGPVLGSGRTVAKRGTAACLAKRSFASAALKQRLGRTLMACDFAEAGVNNPSKHNISERMCNRLTAVEPAPLRRRASRPRTIFLRAAG